LEEVEVRRADAGEGRFGVLPRRRRRAGRDVGERHRRVGRGTSRTPGIGFLEHCESGLRLAAQHLGETERDGCVERGSGGGRLLHDGLGECIRAIAVSPDERR
jgi:hypothetical protein